MWTVQLLKIKFAENYSNGEEKRNSFEITQWKIVLKDQKKKTVTFTSIGLEPFSNVNLLSLAGIEPTSLPS